MTKKITIIGNSVALRKRPPVPLPYNLTYGELLERNLNKIVLKPFQVNNIAKQRNHLKDILSNLDSYVQTFPDFYILNIGIVEATTRDIPLWLSDIKDLQEKQFKVTSRLVNFLYNELIKQHRSFFVKIRGKRSWYSKKAFEKYYDLLISRLKKETNAKLILLQINGPSKRLESLAPGTNKNIIEFNKRINTLGNIHHIPVITTEHLVEEVIFPDGVHYSTEGHKIIAEKIIKYILKNQQ